jgi:dCTP deaminase
MTVLSAQTIYELKLVTPCLRAGKDSQGNSYGLSACSYDVTLAQDVSLWPGDFVLASAVERFDIPDFVVGIVHDKSSLARKGLAVQNTILDPGWHGHMTLELTNHGSQVIEMKRGDAIAQVVFHMLDEPTSLPYAGKYQDQDSEPTPAK